MLNKGSLGLCRKKICGKAKVETRRNVERVTRENVHLILKQKCKLQSQNGILQDL